jgi:hypothetical protein
MNKLNILFICAAFFLLGCQKNNPAPTSTTPTATVVVAQNINNSYTISSTTYGNTTYNTTTGTEETQTNNGISFYILTIADNHNTLDCQFWFNSKPSPGTYYISNFKSSYSYGVSAGCVAITALSPNTQYLSQSSGSIVVSASGNNFIVTATNIPAANISNSSDIRNLTTTATIP